MNKKIQLPQTESWYRVEEQEKAPHGNFNEYLQDTDFNIIDTCSGKTILSFTGTNRATLGENCSWENWTYSGVDKVEISDDGRFALVYENSSTVPRMVELRNAPSPDQQEIESAGKI